MKTNRIILILGILPIVFLSYAQEIKKLPAPVMEGGKPLMEVLKNRKSDRNFVDRALSEQQLSDLLWAAWGINRPETGKRTAPSSRNMQEIDVYLISADGVFLYEPKQHALIQVLDDDVREATGTQEYVKNASLNLIYVADYTRIGNADPEKRQFSTGADVGFIAQNVYLYCASEGLGVVVRASFDKEALHDLMKLTKNQEIILAQSVGITE